MSIASEIERIQTAKESIRVSLENKTEETVSESLRLEDYPSIIDGIKTKGTYQSKMAIPSTEQQDIRPDIGYDALSNVVVDRVPLEETTIIPKPSGLEVLPSGNNIGFSKVTIPAEYNLTETNVKNGVTIYGVTGTYIGDGGGSSGSSNYSELGVKVSVEAKNGFYAGDRFVGIKNEGIEPEMTNVIMGDGNSLAAASEDGSVIIYQQTIKNTSTSIKVGKLNDEDGTYTTVNASISGDMSGVQRKALNYEICNLTEDGTKMVTLLKDSKNVAGVLIVNINKAAKSASAVYDANLGITGLAIKVNDTTTYFDGYITSINNNGVALIGDYLLVAGDCKYNEGTLMSGGYFSFRVNSSSASFDAIVEKTAIPYPIYAYSVGYPSKGLAVANAYSIYWQLSYSGGITVLKRFSNSSCTYATISRNGRYCANDGKAFIIDFSNGTLTQLINAGTNTGYNSFIDNSGEYMLALLNNSTGNIYEVATGKVFISEAKACTSRYFGIMGDEFYLSGKYKCYVSYSGAQYLIYRTQAYITEADRVYGIVPENMTMGDVGTAQALFNTFGLELASETTE